MNNLIKHIVAFVSGFMHESIGRPLLMFAAPATVIIFAVLNIFLSPAHPFLLLLTALVSSYAMFILPVYEFRNGEGSAYTRIGKPSMAKIIMYAYLALGVMYAVTGILVIVGMPLHGIASTLIGVSIFIHGWVHLDSIKATEV